MWQLFDHDIDAFADCFDETRPRFLNASSEERSHFLLASLQGFGGSVGLLSISVGLLSILLLLGLALGLARPPCEEFQFPPDFGDQLVQLVLLGPDFGAKAAFLSPDFAIARILGIQKIRKLAERAHPQGMVG